MDSPFLCAQIGEKELFAQIGAIEEGVDPVGAVDGQHRHRHAVEQGFENSSSGQMER